ncbi:hypothetical protein OIV83_004222 [Microbotryomycetes sp. JL201]|nr:hypothetical protein OIV83_004222 [Microbotryomycetes sp. JL201]
MFSSVATCALLAGTATALSIQEPAAPFTYPSLKACPATAASVQYSCENKTAIENTCCSPTPGGLVLATQFWNTYTNMESSGQFLPARHWGIHGLWPDNCDGSYESYCDLSRQIDPEPSPNTTTGKPDGTPVPAWTGESATEILESFGRHDLLNYMNGYWIARDQPNDYLWAHEYAKHATCFSTFDKKCYESHQPWEDAIDYWQAAIRANKQYPTWDILASQGIVPSNSTTYSLQDLENAFVAQVGAKPFFGCSGPEPSGQRTVLSEVWVYAHVLGTPQFGQYKAIDSTTASSCSNTTGIHYYERTPSSEVSKFVS